MHPLLLSLAAACLYAGAALYQGLRLQQRSTSNKRLLIALGTLALLLHGSSLFAAAVILLTLLACMRIPVENLLLLLFPLGFVTVLPAQFMPSGTTQAIDEAPGILAHILLSITAYGMLTIAVFQSRSEERRVGKEGR